MEGQGGGMGGEYGGEFGGEMGGTGGAAGGGERGQQGADTMGDLLMSNAAQDAEEEARRAQEAADRALLERATKRLKKCLEAVQANREQQRIDVRFRIGGEYQWDPLVLQRRKARRRPSETFNKTDRFVHEIVNNARMNRPVIRVGPGSPDASDKVAVALEDAVRNIEFESDADVSYDTGIEHAAERGEGYIGADPEYVDDIGGVVMPRIKRFRNPWAELHDPDCKQPDASDAKYWFSLVWLDEDDFKATWPDEDESAPGDERSDKGWFGRAMGRYARRIFRVKSGGESLDVPNEDGVTGTRICVAKYFEVQESVEYLDPADRQGQADAAEAGVDRRQMRVNRTVGMYWISRARVLERSEWLGRYIPRFKVSGVEIDDNGHVVNAGVIRHIRGDQRALNYAKNSALEDLGLYGKKPPMVPNGSLTGFEQDWKTAHTDPVAYLTYNQYDENDKPLNAPLVPPPAQPSSGALALAQESEQSMFSETGIAPANLMQDPSAKGQAHEIERQRKGEVATFHYADNLARAMRSLGRCLVDALPNYLEGQTQVHGRTEAGKPRKIRLGKMEGQPDGEAVTPWHEPDPSSPSGVKTDEMLDLSVGKYQVWVDAGPSLPTRQRETIEAVMEMIGVLSKAGSPQAAQAAMALVPLVAKMMDAPEHELMYDLVVATLPENLQQIYTNTGDPNAERNAALAQQQLAAAQQAIQQLQQMLQAQGAQLRDKQIDQKIKIVEAYLQLAGQKVKARADVAKAGIAARTHIHGMVVDHAGGMLRDSHAAGLADAANADTESAGGAEEAAAAQTLQG